MLGVLFALSARADAAFQVSGADLSALGGLAVACAAWAVIGGGVGAVVRQQVAAIVGAVLWVLLIENLGAAFLGEAGRFLPGQTAHAVARAAASPEILDPAAGAVLLAGYATVVLAVAAARLQRSDV